MDSTYKGPERRRLPRVRAEFIVIYRVNRPLKVLMLIGTREVNALMLDLSEGGMAVVTDYDIPVSTILLIKFTLINLHVAKDEQVRVMEIIGEVRNNILSKKDEHRLGIYFTRIAEEDKSAIATFVKMTMK